MNQLDQLAQHRDAILLAEIGAWLHMLGKYDWQFIESHCGGTTRYDYKNFMSGVAANYPELFRLLDLNSVQYQSVISGLPLTSPSSVGVFIRDHQQTNESRKDSLADQLTMLLVDAHGRGSNIEKSEVQSTFPGQVLPHVYLSTAFGFTKQLTATNYRTTLLHQALDNLLSHLSTSTNADKWAGFIQQLRQELFSHFSTALAETRLPFNDVTLLEQTTSTVAFFKSALVERVVAGNWKRLMDGSKNQYKWRTLSIPIAGLEYLQNTSGIADLLGKQNILTQAQNAVQDLLEVTYPVGQEIYRDEQTSVFLVPDEAGLLQWQNDHGQNLEVLIQREISQATNGDIFPKLQNSLMLQGTRTLYTTGQQIATISASATTSDVVPLTEAWRGVNNQQVCSTCSLRPHGSSHKTSSRKLCDICLTRRERRSEEWATDEIDQTIWLDEVADDNGRLALLVGSWGLTEWLNGTLVNTIIAASDLDFAKLENDCRRSLQSTKKGNPQQFQGVLTTILNNHVREQFNHQFRGYFASIIQPEWQHLTGSGLSEETIAAMHFVRQNPSFARLRRIWQTTQTFWQTALHEANSASKPLIPPVPKRLQIIPKNRDNLDLGHYHAYDFKLPNNITLSVVWDPKRKLFITCDNLEYLAKPDLLGKPVVECLTGERTLEEPTGYGGESKQWGKIAIEQVSEMPNSSYTPAIPILAQPRTFMTLLPANKALDIAAAIQSKYQREMGKVRNRLPLHLGLVYFHRRTPLRAALDAGRRMLNYELGLRKDELWTVQEVGCLRQDELPEALVKDTKQFDLTVAVKLEQNGRFLTWHIPTVMGDGTTPDKWYPYVFISNREGTFKAPRPTNSGSTQQCWLIHASQLQTGDQIYFTPATLDFQWLDNAGRRFEIAYDPQTGQRRTHPTRPYLLDELGTLKETWERIANGLSSSQIYALRDLIESKRESWQPTAEQCAKTGMFWQFCHDAITTADWKQKPTKEQINDLTNCAVSGLLTDVIHLYMGIMKQKPQQEENTNE